MTKEIPATSNESQDKVVKISNVLVNVFHRK